MGLTTAGNFKHPLPPLHTLTSSYMGVGGCGREGVGAGVAQYIIYYYSLSPCNLALYFHASLLTMCARVALSATSAVPLSHVACPKLETPEEDERQKREKEEEEEEKELH